MTDEYKPGDKPPQGYLQWHAWAEVQRKAGIRQKRCPTCKLWITPQETEDHGKGLCSELTSPSNVRYKPLK